MARTYGNTITLELSVPASVTDDDRCPTPVAKSLAVYRAAVEAADAERDKLDELGIRWADEDAAARAAARAGHKLPALTPEPVRSGALADQRVAARTAQTVAKRAAATHEQTVRDNRVELRALLAEQLVDKRDAAAAAFRAARAADAALGGLIESLRLLDASAVSALNDKALVARHYGQASRGARPIDNSWNVGQAWDGLALRATGLDVELLTTDPVDPDRLEQLKRQELDERLAREGMPPVEWGGARRLGS